MNKSVSMFDRIKGILSDKTKLKVYIKDNTVYICLALGAYLLLLLLSAHISIASSAHPDASVFESFFYGLNHFMNSPFDLKGIEQSFGSFFSSSGMVTVIYIFAAMWLKFEKEKRGNTMVGKEAGTAAWNKDLAAYNKVYTDPKDSALNDGPYNMILTQDVFLNMNTRITRRNNNVCVVGGSGSGKSRFFVKPNILQANTNYVITDPSGELLSTTGHFLEEQGYDIKIFNLVEMAKSDCYNPFNYIRDELGVLMMINCLIQNTNPDGKSGGDPFWEKSETALLQALCFYLWKYRPKKEQNFTSVMKLLRLAEINEQNPNAKSQLDIIFSEIEKQDPTSIAVKQYKTFKMGAGKTLKSILISCSVRLTVFNLKQIENLTGRDTIDLASMGNGKKALFVIIPSADSTYNFLVSMMYSQLFETLYYIAENVNVQTKRLESPVRFLLDEFANIGTIPEFNKKLATMRKYEISCNIILQNLAQIKTMYKDDWQTIIGNCDSFLFLGGQEYDTLEYISKELGDQTITAIDHSRSRGSKGSSSESRKHQARKLMTPDEIGRMKDSECILIIRGLNPFKGNKYEYTKHPNYKYTADANPDFLFINTINNSSIEELDVLEKNYAMNKINRYEKATLNQRPDNRLIGDIKSINGLAKSLNIKNAADLFSRFILLPPDPITEMIAAEINRKEQELENFIPDIQIVNNIKNVVIDDLHPELRFERIEDDPNITPIIKNVEDDFNPTFSLQNAEDSSNSSNSSDSILDKEECYHQTFNTNKNKDEQKIDDSYIGTLVKPSVIDEESERNTAEEWYFESF